MNPIFFGLLVIASASQGLLAGQPVQATDSFEGHGYKFVPYPRPWHLAKKDAENQGGYLVAIGSQAEQDFVINLVRKGTGGPMPAIWIGLTDEEEEGNWKWVNGEKPSFYCWTNGEPNNHSNAENAVLLFLNDQGAGAWNDCHSDARSHYVIEFDRADRMPRPRIDPPQANSTNRYEFVGQAKTWREAQEHAKAKGGHLVVINSAEEQAAVERISQNPDGKQSAIWIGFSDEEKEGDWEWVNGEEITYTNWGPGNPDNGYGLQDYAWIGWYGDGRWDDLQPDAKLAFVIEYPAKQGSATRSLRKTR